MANNMSEAMSILSKNGFAFDSLTFYKKMRYSIRHKYKPVIYIPMVAIDNAIAFMIDTGAKSVMTLDGFECDVKSSEIKNIIQCDEEVMEIYGIPWYSFVFAWNKSMDNMRTLEFFRMELKKNEQ